MDRMEAMGPHQVYEYEIGALLPPDPRRTERKAIAVRSQVGPIRSCAPASSSLPRPENAPCLLY